MNRKSLFACVAGTLLCILLPSLTSAMGTPDGLPPPMETICDGQSGAAYGLCNAYCEAMDCDSDMPSASETACQKVANKYTQFTGEPVPCSGNNSCVLIPYFETFTNLIENPGQIMSCTSNWNSQPDSLAACTETGYCNPINGGTWGAVWDTGSGMTKYVGGDNTIPEGMGFETSDDFYACRTLLEEAIIRDLGGLGACALQ